MMLPRVLALLLATALAATAGFMLFAPGVWYIHFPGAAETGPYNPHFVRLLGCVFAVGAAVLAVYGLRRKDPPASGLVAFAAFVAADALIHLWEIDALGAHAWAALLRDLPGVYLPAVLTVWFARSALAARRTQQPTGGAPFMIGQELAEQATLRSLRLR